MGETVPTIQERLRENAEHHRDIARDADMRPEDTCNWRHAVDDEEAADLIDALIAERDEARALCAHELSHEAHREMVVRLAIEQCVQILETRAAEWDKLVKPHAASFAGELRFNAKAIRRALLPPTAPDSADEGKAP